jgi:hypothetical protein
MYGNSEYEKLIEINVQHKQFLLLIDHLWMILAFF